MTLSGIEPTTFRIMALCLKQLLYFSINCKIGKEITYSCATEIRIAMFIGPSIASLLGSILAGHNFRFIYLRSILILSFLLRMLPPSGVLCCSYSCKGLFVYFLTVMRATGSANLFLDTTKCAVRHSRQWQIFDNNYCYIFNGKY